MEDELPKNDDRVNAAIIEYFSTKKDIPLRTAKMIEEIKELADSYDYSQHPNVIL